jgi:hypothetical protein
VKLNKTILKNIIKEELENLKENPITVQDLALAAATDVNRPKEPETPLESRVQQIIAKMSPAESLLKSIDDPKELIELLVAMVKHIKNLNPDLSPAELQRTIDILRTKTLPAMRKQVK